MGKLRARRVMAASVLLAAAGLSGCGPRQPWRSELVSVNADGTNSGNGQSSGSMLSPDGTDVLFVSAADDLGPVDTNGHQDVYLRDLESGTTTLVSVNADGTDSGGGESVGPVFSPDGTKIAFHSEADDLGPSDANGATDVYVRDLVSGTTTLVSANAAGTDSASGQSTNPVFAPDGTGIAFSSLAGDLGPTDGNGVTDVYLRDLVSGTTSLVSVNATGDSGGAGASFGPAVFSPDGTKIAFDSYASDLGPTDSRRFTGIPLLPFFEADVYLRDLATATTSLVSANAAGTDSANGTSTGPVFSPDGTKIAFNSQGSNLGPVDSPAETDVYVRDLPSGTASLVSANAGGSDGGNEASYFGVFSPDGTKMVFHSLATDLGPTDTNDDEDVYLRDLASGTTTLVSVDTAGTASGDSSSFGVFSPDGTKVAFQSVATDLGPTDTNDDDDVYVRDLVSGTTTLVSANAAGTDSGNDDSSRPAFSADGRQVLFLSRASNLGPRDGPRPTDLVDPDQDVYVATLRGADLSLAGTAEPDPVEPGGTVTYRLELANRGPDRAEDATVAVLVPEGATFDAAEATLGECRDPGRETPQVVVCQLGDIAVDATGQVTVTASVEAQAPAGTALTAVGAVSSESTVDPVHNNNVVVLGSTVAGA